MEEALRRSWIGCNKLNAISKFIKIDKPNSLLEEAELFLAISIS